MTAVDVRRAGADHRATHPTVPPQASLTSRRAQCHIVCHRGEYGCAGADLAKQPEHSPPVAWQKVVRVEGVGARQLKQVLFFQ